MAYGGPGGRRRGAQGEGDDPRGGKVAKIMGKGFEQCLASHLATLFEPDDDRDEETLAGLARNKLTSIDNIKTVTKMVTEEHDLNDPAAQAAIKSLKTLVCSITPVEALSIAKLAWGSGPSGVAGLRRPNRTDAWLAKELAALLKVEKEVPDLYERCIIVNIDNTVGYSPLCIFSNYDERCRYFTTDGDVHPGGFFCKACNRIWPIYPMPTAVVTLTKGCGKGWGAHAWCQQPKSAFNKPAKQLAKELGAFNAKHAPTADTTLHEFGNHLFGWAPLSGFTPAQSLAHLLQHLKTDGHMAAMDTLRISSRQEPGGFPQLLPALAQDCGVRLCRFLLPEHGRVAEEGEEYEEDISPRDADEDGQFVDQPSCPDAAAEAAAGAGAGWDRSGAGAAAATGTGGAAATAAGTGQAVTSGGAAVAQPLVGMGRGAATAAEAEAGAQGANGAPGGPTEAPTATMGSLGPGGRPLEGRYDANTKMWLACPICSQPHGMNTCCKCGSMCKANATTRELVCPKHPESYRVARK